LRVCGLKSKPGSPENLGLPQPPQDWKTPIAKTLLIYTVECRVSTADFIRAMLRKGCYAVSAARAFFKKYSGGFLLILNSPRDAVRVSPLNRLVKIAMGSSSPVLTTGL
jgi:hypothetical protein